MSRKEEIIFAALELAAQKGLKAVMLSQIADRVGIKKPSIYNHFASKEDLVNEMYSFIREKAGQQAQPVSGLELMYKEKSLKEILLISFKEYVRFITDENMLKFLKVLYSERSTSPAAAQIMLEETERMLAAIRNMFYALTVHGKMRNEEVDTAALSYAMTIHSLVDRRMDMMTAGRCEIGELLEIPEEIYEYICWFSMKMGVDEK